MKRRFVAGMVVLLACFVILGFILPRLHRGSGPPPELQTAGKIARGMGLYAKRNGGVWATNWLQLLSTDELSRGLIEDTQVLLPQAFAFLPAPLPLTNGPYQGELVIIEREPRRISGERGRYMVYHSSYDGFFWEGWMEEQQVQAILSTSKVTIPGVNPVEMQAAGEALKLTRTGAPPSPP